MYCSACGVELPSGLSYCNRCGANLNSSAVTKQVLHIEGLTKPTLAVGATTAVLTLGGFIAVIAGATQLASLHMGTEPVMGTIVLGMLIILISDFMLIRQLSRMVSATLKQCSPTQTKPSLPAIERPQQQLPTHSDLVMPSVTEGTTRTLEPSFRAPNS